MSNSYKKAVMNNGVLTVPDFVKIPFIIGDGTGPDIWRAAMCVFDESIRKAYGGRRKIEWIEMLAGGKAHDETGQWLPKETLQAFREMLIGIKGPLTTPVGGGIRSLNVAIRQLMDLYFSLRPVRYFRGVPSPVKHQSSWIWSSSVKIPRMFMRASSSSRETKTRKSCSRS